MDRIFGKKKKAGPPAPGLADHSASMGGRVEEMDKKILSLENELRGHKDKIKKARTPAAKQAAQRRAMEVLKRKKMYESQRDMVAGQQFNIDQASFNIESAKANVQTVAAMKSANNELKRTMKHDLRIDDVEDLADEMAEMMEDFNEINEALASNYATPEVDEADLDAELELLEDEMFEEEAALGEDATPSYLQTTEMPETPTTELPNQEVGMPAMPT